MKKIKLIFNGSNNLITIHDNETGEYLFELCYFSMTQLFVNRNVFDQLKELGYDVSEHNFNFFKKDPSFIRWC